MAHAGSGSRRHGGGGVSRRMVVVEEIDRFPLGRRHC
jgi:hypothetical protein